MSKLLFIQPSLTGVGGVESVLPVIGAGLIGKGHTITTASFYDRMDFYPSWSTSHNSLCEVVTKGLLAKINKVIKRAQFIIKITQQENPDFVIVSTHGSSLICLLLRALRLVDVPIVIYVHQSLYKSDTGYQTLTTILYRFAAGFICVSKGLMSELKNFTKKTTPIVVAYNPYTSIFSDTKNEVQNMKFDSPVFISAARLEKIRGTDILIDYFCRYLSNHPGTLVVLGDGSQKSAHELQVSKAGLTERIKFYGAVSNVKSYLKLADVYVSFAQTEAFGVSLVEALAAGVPLVVTDVPYGPREIMNIGNDNLIYPYKTTYGYLLKPAKKVTKYQLNDDTYDNFISAVTSLLNDTSSIKIQDLEERAKFFSIDSAVSSIQTLLDQVKSSTV